MNDGVIQYFLDFTPRKLSNELSLDDLNACRSRLFRLHLIGQDPQRYGGYGFGNISQRVTLPEQRNAFVITGSQTGHLPVLEPQHFAVVTACDPKRNALQAFGETQPSSEAMTHAVIYQVLPRMQAVIHVHSPDLWQNMQKAGAPATPKAAAYGTPEMADAVVRVLARHWMASSGVLVMLGHEDGVVAWGTTLAGAEAQLMQFMTF